MIVAIVDIEAHFQAFTMTGVILNLLFPFPLCVLALTIAVILFSIQRRQTLAVVLTVITAMILLICGTAPFPTLLVNQLEQRHSPPWDRVDSEIVATGVRYVAVLGGSVISAPAPIYRKGYRLIGWLSG